MMELKFYGASDDLFEVDDGARDEINCYDKPGTYRVRSESAAAGVFVSGLYSPNHTSCWQISLEPIDEGHWPVLAKWGFEFCANDDNDYSPCLRITNAPHDCEVTVL